MAHECPECGQVCYCGSDIDDSLLNFDDDVDGCDHCVGKDHDEYDDFDDSDHEQTDVRQVPVHIGSKFGDVKPRK